MNKESERRLLVIAGALWLVAGVFAIIASRITDGLPAFYILMPFAVGTALIAWSFKMGEDAEAAAQAATERDLPDGEPQPA